MKKIAFLLLVISVLLPGCSKNDEQTVLDPAAEAALLEIHDFKGAGVILDENTTVRSAPDDSAEDNVVGMLQKGTKIEITKRKGRKLIIDGTVVFWYEATAGGLTGWVYGQSVSLDK